MSYLLDTNILSTHLRRPSGLQHRFVQHFGRLYTSSVALAELYDWAYRRPDPAAALAAVDKMLLHEVATIDFDNDCAQECGPGGTARAKRWPWYARHATTPFTAFRAYHRTRATSRLHPDSPRFHGIWSISAPEYFGILALGMVQACLPAVGYARLHVGFLFAIQDQEVTDAPFPGTKGKVKARFCHIDGFRSQQIRPRFTAAFHSVRILLHPTDISTTILEGGQIQKIRADGWPIGAQSYEPRVEGGSAPVAALLNSDAFDFSIARREIPVRAYVRGLADR